MVDMGVAWVWLTVFLGWKVECIVYMQRQINGYKCGYIPVALIAKTNLCGVQSKLFDHCQRLCSKGFIQLKEVHIVNTPTSLSQL